MKLEIPLSEEQTIQDQKLVSRISIFHVLIVFSIKIVTSLFTNSLSFLAELSDSILDFLAVFITYIALKEGRKPADLKHMYGHYKVNAIAGLFQSFLIIGLYFFIFYNALTTIIFSVGSYKTINGLGAAGSLIFILVIVYFNSKKIIKIGKKSNNPLIIAQGVNFRGDFYQNITFIIGLIVASLGFFIIDIILALIFSGISIFQCLKVIRHSSDELLDTNKISQDIIDEVKKAINGLSGVENLEFIAIKTAGNHLKAEISVFINKEKSVFSANELSSEIRRIMEKNFKDYTTNVMIQFNSDHILDIKSTDYLFETIRKIADDEIGISSIHNISLDIYLDKILVQFHLDVGPQMKLKEAHEFTSKIERNIADRLKLMPDLKQHIEIVTHLEPARLIKKEHSHTMDKHILPDHLKSKIINYMGLFRTIR